MIDYEQAMFKTRAQALLQHYLNYSISDRVAPNTAASLRLDGGTHRIESSTMIITGRTVPRAEFAAYVPVCPFHTFCQAIRSLGTAIFG